MLLTFFREDPSFHFEDIDVDLPICKFTYLLSQISLLHRINLVKSRKVILYNNHQLVKYCMTSENVFGDKGTIYYFQDLSYSLNCSKLSLKLFLQINGGNRCVIHLTLPNCLLPEDQFCPPLLFYCRKNLCQAYFTGSSQWLVCSHKFSFSCPSHQRDAMMLQPRAMWPH